MKILQFPLTKVTLAFILGLLFYQKYLPDLLLIFISLIIGIVLLIAFHFLSKKNELFKNCFGIGVFWVAFAIGNSTAAFHNDTLRSNHYTHLIPDESAHETTLVIHEKLKSTLKNTRYVANIKSVDDHQAFGKIILNIRKKDQIDGFAIGSQLMVSGKIYKNKNPFNPNQFDYGKYLENQQIYSQIYADKTQIKSTGTEATLWSNFANFRARIIKNLERSDFKKDELNIVIALLLGQQQDISPEILKEYQLAGAVHILSVSGLHVGFILLFVSFLLKPMANTKRNAILKLSLVLLSLWSYGLLAGMAPSVVRSVTMFSFIAVGQHLRRTVNSFHTLLVSMLLILLWKPSFLFDVGFQLSYLALFFILWLQPLLADIWTPKNKILHYLWDIITVSFAAQIGTLPLSIYYFHQFPGLFFITNIIVLPLLGIIMLIGLIVIVMACFGKVPVPAVKSLEFLIELQNAIISRIAAYEDFVFKNISFNTAMLWVSYLVIITLILWFKKPDFKRLAIAFLAIIALQGVFIQAKSEANNTQELIVFNSRKSTLISERKNSQVTFYGNDSILKTLDNNLTVQSYLVGNFCQKQETRKLQNMLFFAHKKILVIDSAARYVKDIKPDIVIITHSPKFNLERFLLVCRPKQIVVDGSNYKSYMKYWEATCRKEKIPFHYTGEKGFYKI